MAKRQKPDFSDGMGEILDEAFFSSPVRNELLLHLKKSPLTDAQKTNLIAFSGDIGQTLIGDLNSDALQVQRDQIEIVGTNARRLLASLNSFGESAKQTMQSKAGYLVAGSEPSVNIDPHVKAAIKTRQGDLLDMSWDWIDALEKAATYTAAQYKLDRQIKPPQIRARVFVTMQAEHIRTLTGKLPPKSPSGWFAAFADCIGSHIGLPAGSKIVKSGIEGVPLIP